MFSPTMQNPRHLKFIQAKDLEQESAQDSELSPRVPVRIIPSAMSLVEYVSGSKTQACPTDHSGRRDAPLKAVQLEALVVMKVIKHCATRFPTTATGSLVGMDVDGMLQVTNTFPFPVVDLPPDAQYEQQYFNAAAAAPRAKANTGYQAEMIRMLREVNVDANNVGWYTSANLGSFINSNFIENQYYYQKDLNERTVALVHDVSRSSQGVLSLRAFRLSSQFMTVYKENKFTTDK